MDNFVITINRGFGSGGKQIARELSKILEVPYYDSQILHMASDDSGINKELFFQVNEKLRGNSLIKKLKTYSGNENIIEPISKKFVSDVNLYNIQAKIIREIALRQSCIIVGKCANYLLKDNDNVVSVYVKSPLEHSIKNVMDRCGGTPAEAEKMIKSTDKYRSEYYKYYTSGQDWTDINFYDLAINTDRISQEKSIELIIEYLKMKLGDDILSKKGEVDLEL